MAVSPESRIFISYAHRDGAELAARLAADLESRGFDVWLDRKRIKAGDRWDGEIQRALDGADVLLALLSDGSFNSDVCQAEQGWALDSGKRVIPLRVQSACKVPLRLYTAQYLDFTEPAGYEQSLDRLLKALGETSDAARQKALRRIHNNAPPLPD